MRLQNKIERKLRSFRRLPFKNGNQKLVCFLPVITSRFPSGVPKGGIAVATFPTFQKEDPRDSRKTQ